MLLFILYIYFIHKRLSFTCFYLKKKTIEAFYYYYYCRVVIVFVIFSVRTLPFEGANTIVERHSILSPNQLFSLFYMLVKRSACFHCGQSLNLDIYKILYKYYINLIFELLFFYFFRWVHQIIHVQFYQLIKITFNLLTKHICSCLFLDNSFHDS
jgi:hypothetical protein